MGCGGDYTHCRKPFEDEETRNHLKAIMVETLSVSVAIVFYCALHLQMCSIVIEIGITICFAGEDS